MKKQILLAAFLLVQSIVTYAQDTQNQSLSAFKRGSTTIGLSAGFGGVNNYPASASQYPLFSILFDRSSIENVGPGTIGFGCLAGLKTASYDYGNVVGDGAIYYDIIGVFHTTYHITALKHINNHFDPYAGISFGAKFSTFDDSFLDKYSFQGDNYKVRFAGGLFAGAKYNFTRGFGVFAEFGFDVSNFRTGINFNQHNK